MMSWECKDDHLTGGTAEEHRDKAHSSGQLQQSHLQRTKMEQGCYPDKATCTTHSSQRARSEGETPLGAAAAPVNPPPPDKKNQSTIPQTANVGIWFISVLPNTTRFQLSISVVRNHAVEAIGARRGGKGRRTYTSLESTRATWAIPAAKPLRNPISINS